MTFPKTHPKTKNIIKFFAINSELILLLSNIVAADTIKLIGIPKKKIPKKELISNFIKKRLSDTAFLVLSGFINLTKAVKYKIKETASNIDTAYWNIMLATLCVIPIAL